MYVFASLLAFSLFPQEYIVEFTEFVSFNSVSLDERHFIVLRNEWQHGPDAENSGLPIIVCFPTCQFFPGTEVTELVSSQILIMLLVAYSVLLLKKKNTPINLIIATNIY